MNHSELCSLVRNWIPDVCIKDIVAIEGGLINSTWKVSGTTDNRDEEIYFILQRVNTAVFNNVSAISNNWKRLQDEMHRSCSGQPPLIPSLLEAWDGSNHLVCSSGVYRMMSYFDNCICFHQAASPVIAFNAAKLFGRFLKEFAHIQVSELQVTIPDFHNLPIRYHQFLNSIETGVSERIVACSELISETKRLFHIVETFEQLVENKVLIARVVHHDAKMSNVLLDEASLIGKAVIDLDTCMEGYFISDIGDILRTQLCSVDESCSDYSKISIRLELFESLIGGYLSEVIGVIPIEELRYSVFAGEFMIFMQALRFGADYLNGDIYYKVAYPSQNYDRWKNQMTLLKCYSEAKPRMVEILDQIIIKASQQI